MTIGELLELDTYLNRKKLKDNFLDYEVYQELILQHNREFIARKYREYSDYFDHIFDLIDPNIKLDMEQRIAILTDEDYNLIIAGAGSGKTTTMLAKIKYLIEKQNVDPSQILAISFGRKNVEELQKKIESKIWLECYYYDIS